MTKKKRFKKIGNEERLRKTNKENQFETQTKMQQTEEEFIFGFCYVMCSTV